MTPAPNANARVPDGPVTADMIFDADKHALEVFMSRSPAKDMSSHEHRQLMADHINAALRASPAALTVPQPQPNPLLEAAEKNAIKDRMIESVRERDAKAAMIDDVIGDLRQIAAKCLPMQSTTFHEIDNVIRKLEPFEKR